MTPFQLISKINALIYENTTGLITGSVMQDVLLSIANTLGIGGTGSSTTAYLLAAEQLQPGATAFLIGQLPPEPGDPINIHWNHTAYVTPGGVLYTFIARTGIQMDQLTALAATIAV